MRVFHFAFLIIIYISDKIRQIFVLLGNERWQILQRERIRMEMFEFDPHGVSKCRL